MKLTTMTMAQIAFITNHPELHPFFTTTATTITVQGDPVEALKALSQRRDRYMGTGRKDQLVASASIVRKLTKAIQGRNALPEQKEARDGS